MIPYRSHLPCLLFTLAVVVFVILVVWAIASYSCSVGVSGQDTVGEGHEHVDAINGEFIANCNDYDEADEPLRINCWEVISLYAIVVGCLYVWASTRPQSAGAAASARPPVHLRCLLPSLLVVLFLVLAGGAGLSNFRNLQVGAASHNEPRNPDAPTTISWSRNVTAEKGTFKWTSTVFRPVPQPFVAPSGTRRVLATWDWGGVMHFARWQDFQGLSDQASEVIDMETLDVKQWVVLVAFVLLFGTPYAVVWCLRRRRRLVATQTG